MPTSWAKRARSLSSAWIRASTASMLLRILPRPPVVGVTPGRSLPGPALVGPPLLEPPLLGPPLLGLPLLGLPLLGSTLPGRPLLGGFLRLAMLAPHAC